MGRENRINHPIDPRNFSEEKVSRSWMQWGTGEELVFYIRTGGEISFETKQYNGAFWAEPHVAVSLSVCYLSETREWTQNWFGWNSLNVLHVSLTQKSDHDTSLFKCPSLVHFGAQSEARSNQTHAVLLLPDWKWKTCYLLYYTRSFV